MFMTYFTIEELSRSATANRLGIRNWPDPLAKANLEELVENVLDPLREAWGGPIVVNSGYRSRELNIAIGGAPNSHHLQGMAADITVGSLVNNKKLFELIQKLDLPFTQLIDESSYSWVHVSYDRTDLRKQVIHLR